MEVPIDHHGIYPYVADRAMQAIQRVIVRSTRAVRRGISDHDRRTFPWPRRILRTLMCQSDRDAGFLYEAPNQDMLAVLLCKYEYELSAMQSKGCMPK